MTGDFSFALVLAPMASSIPFVMYDLGTAARIHGASGGQCCRRTELPERPEPYVMQDAWTERRYYYWGQLQ